MSGMTKKGQILPPRRVAVMVPDGARLIGLIGCLDAFDAVNLVMARRDRPPIYELHTVGTNTRVRAASGTVLRTERSSELDEVHTLILGASLDHAESPLPKRFLAEAARLARTAERVVSICAGSFALGELGLLDGRRCTSHWLVLDQMRSRFPEAIVEDDAIFTEDGPIFTSAGASAGIDLALHLIRADAGSRVALLVARALVVFAWRPGGQSQFGTVTRLRPGASQRFFDLISHVQRNPAADHAVERLAHRAGMSPRHFARVFAEQTGETPAAFVARVRVEAAQRALAHTDASLIAIAEDCGFVSEKTLRRTFVRVVGVTPSAWRRRFAVGM